MVRLTDPFSLLDSFFFNYQKETKPPVEIYPVYDDEERIIKGWKIQMAVAGFDNAYSGGDLQVWTDGRKIHIKGDNTKRDLCERFKSSFHHTYTASDKLDLDKIYADAELGILTVFIPIKEEEILKPKRVWGDLPKLKE